MLECEWDVFIGTKEQVLDLGYVNICQLEFIGFFGGVLFYSYCLFIIVGERSRY